MADRPDPLPFDELLAALPAAAAATVALDVASGQPGGVRSPEHEHALELTRQLRAHLRAGENVAFRALVAIGYDAASARAWLRRDDGTPEPRPVNPNGEETVRIRVFDPDSLAREFGADRNVGYPVVPPGGQPPHAKAPTPVSDPEA